MSWFMNSRQDRALLEGVVALIDNTDTPFETKTYKVRIPAVNAFTTDSFYPHLQHLSGEIEICRPAESFTPQAEHLVRIRDHRINPSRHYRRRIAEAFRRRDARAASKTLGSMLEAGHDAILANLEKSREALSLGIPYTQT